MAIPVEHVLELKAVANNSYPFMVVCSCQWQACARSRADALAYARNHAGVQAYRGNDVTVDWREFDERSNGSVETAGAGEATSSEAAPATEAGAGS